MRKTKDTAIYDSDPGNRLAGGNSLRAERLDDGRLRLDIGYAVTIGGAPFTKREMPVVLDAAQEEALISALAVRQAGADPAWTVLGIWDNDEAVPVGAVRGAHSVYGEAPGERIREELLASGKFCGFDTSSFYEQGVWAAVVTAPDGDTAQDLAAAQMMRDQHGDENEDSEYEEGN